jgi:hypothetical protein
VSDGLDELRSEIQRLRDWRHDTAPRLAALEQLVREQTRVWNETVVTVTHMAEQDRIAQAVAERLGKRRGVLLSRSEKSLGFVLAAPGVVATIILLLDRFTG